MTPGWWLRPVVALVVAAAGAAAVHAWNLRVHTAGYAAGVLDERAIWKAQQEIDRLALQKRQAQDQRKADELLAAGRAEAVAAQEFAAALQMDLRRARSRLVVSECPAAAAPVDAALSGPAAAAGGGPGADDGPGVAAPGGAATGGGFKPPRAAPVQGGLHADAGPVLSADAVRLWDSATAGRHVPAGACGPAGEPAAACAAATDITLEDAWANHAANAASCRADRAKHQRLIDFVLSRQGVPGSAP